MQDTTRSIVKAIEVDPINSFDLLDKVNNFYDSAWNKLLFIVTASFTIIGIIVPYIIQWYQKRELKLSEQSLRNTIVSEIEKAKDEILADAKKAVEENALEHKRQLELVTGRSNAAFYYIQATTHLLKKRYLDAFVSSLYSLQLLGKINEWGNLRLTLGNLKEVIPHLTKENLNLVDKEVKFDYVELLNQVAEEQEGKNKSMATEIAKKIVDIKSELKTL